MCFCYIKYWNESDQISAVVSCDTPAMLQAVSVTTTISQFTQKFWQNLAKINLSSQGENKKKKKRKKKRKEKSKRIRKEKEDELLLRQMGYCVMSNNETCLVFKFIYLHSPDVYISRYFTTLSSILGRL